jgi:Icc-related predicted phosphoesterase
MIITFISDTHTKHNQITADLPGGDLLIHAGDISSMGYSHEIDNFCKWFNKLDNYTTKIFIAGNHDWGFQNEPAESKMISANYQGITYLQDDSIKIGPSYDESVNVYGSPWQPEFCNWAFNLQKNGEELQHVWGKIPEDTDILITHGPAFGRLDTVEGRRNENLGCELLAERIKVVKPKIHVCGHIHSGYGYLFDGDTHFFNAAVLNERYSYTQKPMTIAWNPDTNEIHYI